MASIGIVRSVLRVRNVASKIATEVKFSSSARPSFRIPGNASASVSSRFLLRSPVQLSFCVESLLPLHSATASSIMTSMLSVFPIGYGSLFEDH